MGIFCDGFQNIVTKNFNISIKIFLSIDEALYNYDGMD